MQQAVKIIILCVFFVLFAVIKAETRRILLRFFKFNTTMQNQQLELLELEFNA